MREEKQKYKLAPNESKKKSLAEIEATKQTIKRKWNEREETRTRSDFTQAHHQSKTRSTLKLLLWALISLLLSDHSRPLWAESASTAEAGMLCVNG